METTESVESKQLTRKEKFFFGIADMPTNIIWSTTSTYLLYFLTDIYMIPVIAAGTLMLITRFIDAAIDPFIGHVVDRINTKLGKARPFLLWFAFPLALSGCFLFLTPDFSDTGKIIYAYALYILFVIFYSLVGVPYNAMMTLMTKNRKERAQLSSSRLIFALIGGVLVSFIPLAVNILGSGENELQVQRTGYFNVAIIIGIFVIVGYLLTFFFTKEHFKDAEENTSKSSFGSALRAVAKNGPFFLLTGLNIVGSLRLGLLSGLVIYFVKHALGLTDTFLTIMLMTFFICMIIGAIFGPKYFAWTDYKKGNIYLAIAGILGSVILMIDPTNLIFIFIFLVINGLAQGVGNMSGYPMYGDVVEYGHWKTGIRSQGLIFSSFTLCQQISAGLGAFLISIVLSVTGYTAAAAVQTPQTVNGIMIAFVGLPVLLNIVRIVMYCFYKIDKKMYKQIIAELEERNVSV